MPKYVFLFEYSPKDINAIAFYDQIGGAQLYYLPEFPRFFVDQNLPNLESVMIPFICNIMSHEDLHEEICKEVDTLAGQEHDMMDKICDFLATP